MTAISPRDGSHPRASRLLGRLAAVFVVGSLAWSGALLGARPASAADDPEAEKAGVELMVSTEASIDPGGPLVSTVTVTNHGDDALSAGSVSLEVDRKSTRLNSSHVKTSYAVFCVKKKKTHSQTVRT